jgi:hypothetical protein
MPPPKSVLCYICGRPYLSPSIAIHIEQCKELFEKRESLKPKKERRKLPPDPSLAPMQSSTPTGLLSKGGSSKNIPSDRNFSQQPTIGAYGLTPCPHCNRTFNDTAYERYDRLLGS